MEGLLTFSNADPPKKELEVFLIVEMNITRASN